MGLALEFTSFNGARNLQFLSAKTPDELQALIVQIRSQVSILTIYFDGTNHIAWVQTNFPIKKGITNGISSSSKKSRQRLY